MLAKARDTVIEGMAYPDQPGFPNEVVACLFQGFTFFLILHSMVVVNFNSSITYADYMSGRLGGSRRFLM